MNIINFKEHSEFFTLNNSDIRKYGLLMLNNVTLTGRNPFYPNILLNNNANNLISPYDEKIMSLNKSSFYDNNYYDISSNISSNIISNYKSENIDFPVLFFIYNFDNYYHFLYDTIPYLHFYFYLKTKYHNIKLLINYPNNRMSLYNFNIDILNKFVDINNDIIIHTTKHIYSTIFISTSLTHGGFSNDPPNKIIYNLYSKIKQRIYSFPLNKYNSHKYIYISRRTWINNDTSNIGTNYTTRRKMVNEDKLVNELTKLGIVEVFTENLSIDEKIYLFDNAKLIIGSIGGGMSNLLFSNPTTQSIVIVTPDFLTINSRFKFSLDHTNITYYNDVKTYTEGNKIPLFCRAKITTNNKYQNKIGEISDYNIEKDEYKINLSNNDITGFNNDYNYDYEWFNSSEFDLLDNGLNSPYIVNIPDLISIVKIKLNNNKIYKIINKNNNKEFNINLQDIFTLIKEHPNDDYLKVIDNSYIPINKNIVLNTRFICHRINTVEELIEIPNIFGIEIDIRDDPHTKTLILEHDPFKKGLEFENFLKNYSHNTLILNIKSERVELKCIELMEKYKITNYFFLDSNLPMIYLLNSQYQNSNISCRYSEFEPIEYYDKIKKFISWIWVDCFTKLPISKEIFNIFKNDGKNICIVSPELQYQKEKIVEYRGLLTVNNLIPDAICCKFNNIINWI